MDADQSYAIDQVTLNGLFVNGVVPTAQEGINVATCILQEFAHVVIECADVGTFVVELFEVEDREEPFSHVHQWEREQTLVERESEVLGTIDAFVGFF